jgi:hypothetical protein
LVHPGGQFKAHLLVAVVAFAVTALVVVIHYEGVHWLARRYSRRAPKRDRGAMLQIIFALLGLHIVEIWCYGLAYWGLIQCPGPDSCMATGADTVFDAIYLSAITFSTVGFGDLAPVGADPAGIRDGVLDRMLLITWSAPFTYLEMSRLWRRARSMDAKEKPRSARLFSSARQSLGLECRCTPASASMRCLNAARLSRPRNRRAGHAPSAA